jgi:hypothetical protein
MAGPKGGDGGKGAAAATEDKKVDDKAKEPEVKKTPQQLSHEGEGWHVCAVGVCVCVCV